MGARAEAIAGNVLPEIVTRLAGMLTRHTVTPDFARELGRIWHATDVRGVLLSVQPALLLAQEADPEDVELAEYVASLMPDAKVEVIPADSGTRHR
jgi:hypothetical protein